MDNLFRNKERSNGKGNRKGSCRDHSDRRGYCIIPFIPPGEPLPGMREWEEMLLPGVVAVELKGTASGCACRQWSAGAGGHGGYMRSFHGRSFRKSGDLALHQELRRSKPNTALAWAKRIKSHPIIRSFDCGY